MTKGASETSISTMETSRADSQEKDFMAGMPPIPEGEFCIFGIVNLEHTFSSYHV